MERVGDGKIVVKMVGMSANNVLIVEAGGMKDENQENSVLVPIGG